MWCVCAQGAQDPAKLQQGLNQCSSLDPDYEISTENYKKRVRVVRVEHIQVRAKVGDGVELRRFCASAFPAQGGA